MTGYMSWTQTVEGNPCSIVYKVNGLAAGKAYSVSINDKLVKKLQSKADGSTAFDCKTRYGSGASIIVTKL